MKCEKFNCPLPAVSKVLDGDGEVVAEFCQDHAQTAKFYLVDDGRLRPSWMKKKKHGGGRSKLSLKPSELPAKEREVLLRYGLLKYRQTL